MRYLGASGMAAISRPRGFVLVCRIGTPLLIHGVPGIAARFRGIGGGGA